jgi:hypothetical protein
VTIKAVISSKPLQNVGERHHRSRRRGRGRGRYRRLFRRARRPINGHCWPPAGVDLFQILAGPARPILQFRAQGRGARDERRRDLFRTSGDPERTGRRLSLRRWRHRDQ